MLNNSRRLESVLVERLIGEALGFGVVGGSPRIESCPMALSAVLRARVSRVDGGVALNGITVEAGGTLLFRIKQRHHHCR